MKYNKLNITKWTLLSLSLLAINSCSEDDAITIPQKITNGQVSAVITTEDEKNLLRELPNSIALETADPQADVTITIDEAITAQTIDGFGGALTGSAATLLNNNPEAIEMLYGESGIELSYTRLTVGASDFNKIDSYTYNDINGSEDQLLENFSIEKDRLDENPMIPVAKAIVAKKSGVGFLASPWSAPAWMKSGNNLNGGSLKEANFGVYADYLVKYLEAYENEGISINTITVQNEPLLETENYPSMKMTAADQITFIGSHFGPKLVASGLTTKIIAYDHNFSEDEDPNYPATVLSDSEVKKYTNAAAYHAYNGGPNDISNLKSKIPDAEIYFTEQSGIQNDNTSFGGELNFFMRNVFMGPLRQGAKTVLLWNLVLDQNAGPKNGGCVDCRGILEITNGGTITRNVDYYMLGHFTKYVAPGATVISSTDTASQEVANIAFKNPDGSKVLVLYNTNDTVGVLKVAVKIGATSFNYFLPRRALVTLTWE